MLTEERRDGLEKYLLAILRSDDSRWRDSPAWRTFLNLPANWSAGGSSAASSASSLGLSAISGGPITDPTLWLDAHRELKTLLHDARMYLSKRDQAVTAGEQYEASAGAKRCLVKAGSFITALDKGLKETSGNNGWGGKEGMELLQGEIRRRKDLVSSARKERDGLESLANSLASKRATQNASSATAASTTDKNALFSSSAGGSRPLFSVGRVLGAPLPETDKTRELDNQGVLQLNDEYMREQDRAVEGMLKNVGRMKEIGVAIGEEIDLQNRMLEDLDQDVDK